MDPEIAYQQSLDYLYGFVDYSLTRGLRNMPEKFDLERMRKFMGELNHPEQRYPVIHVAGTKGKGSVSAFCASALKAAGYKVGLYTSPHLQDYAERIQVDGVPISHADLVLLVDQFRLLLDKGTKLTTFEITTALAFQYFYIKGATAVVAEVGLGGRLDATNIVTPVVAAITSISYDHTQVLGNTLSEIAAEKGGIIKPGVPVVVSPQKKESIQVLEKIASDRGSLLIQVGDEYTYKSIEHSLEGQSLEIHWKSLGGNKEKIRLRVPLLGEHQLENAVTAFAALQIACQRGLSIKNRQIQMGFDSTVWPGRFEVLRRDPPLVIDAAHNPDSALRLVQTLDTYFPGRKAILIFGASEDKDIAGMLKELIDHVDHVIFTRSFHPRAIEPKKLLEIVGSHDKPVQIVSEVEDALAEALRLAGDNRMVLVTGSIFIAAAVRHCWYNRDGV
jgi:dihydrofolate synthase/folylpolyglutamate synthase